MQDGGIASSIADGANNPALIQLQRDDSISRWLTGYLYKCCSCVSGGYKMTLLVAAQPSLSPGMMYVSSLSPVIPITGTVQDLGETVTT